jgi:hypothetical protein
MLLSNAPDKARREAPSASCASSTPQLSLVGFGPFVDDVPSTLGDRHLSLAHVDVLVHVSIPETTDRVHHVCLVHRHGATIG